MLAIAFHGRCRQRHDGRVTGAALATLPTLTVFLLLQRYIVRGVVLAGLKG